MTLFGVIWIVAIVMCFSSIKNMVALVIISSVLQCSNVVELGNTGIGPQVITSFAFIIRMMMGFNGRLKLSKRDSRYIYLWICLIAVIVFSSYYNNVLEDTLFKIIQLLIYIVCFFLMFHTYKSTDTDFVYSVIKKLSIALIIIGFIQLGITSRIIPRIGLMKMLFYNDSSATAAATYYNRAFIYFSRYIRIFSTYMEPSYYAGYVVGAFYYFLSIKEKRKGNLFLIIILGVQIILTFSSSAYGAFLLVGILYVLTVKEWKTKFKTLLIGILGFAFMYLVFYDVLDTVIFSKMSSTSAAARISWNDLATTKFLESPVIGNGYKQSRASTIILTLLSETGIIGFAIYVLFNINFIRYVFTKNKNGALYGLSLAILSTIASQAIGVPDLEISTYWMWLNLFAVQYAIESKTKIDGVAIKAPRGKLLNLPVMRA